MTKHLILTTATAAMIALTAGCVDSTSSPTAQTASADASHAVVGLETASGAFEGQNGHVTTGSASVFWAGDAWVISLSSDFTQDDAPDPVVGLGSNGTYDPASKLGPLQSMSGTQSYPLPEGVNIGDYLEVYIWCEEFDVSLGVARLTLL